MHKNATKCNKTQSKWCINKHGASKIIDTFETYHGGVLRGARGGVLRGQTSEALCLREEEIDEEIRTRVRPTTAGHTLQG
jgi:hypothetical protein